MVTIFFTKDYEAFRAYFLESLGKLHGLESRSELGGTGNVTELAMTKKDYNKIDHITT